MRFIAYTLIDITQTGARRDEDAFQYKQHQNYMSFLQTLSLRFNPIIEKKPTVTQASVSNMAFGSAYKGKQTIWTVRFESESDLGVGLDTIANDFEYVPIITELEETVSLPTAVFRGQDSKYTNIIFELDDK